MSKNLSTALRLAALLAVIPWVVFGIYEPLLCGRPFGDPAMVARIYHKIAAVFCPWYYLVDPPEGRMLLFVIHKSRLVHFFEWSVFSMISFGIWTGALRGMLALLNIARERE